jgi:hypothetical protein
MSRLHSLELATRALREHGPVAGFGVFVKLLRDRILGQHRMLFAMTGARALAAKVEVAAILEIRRYSVWADVPPELRADVATAGQFVWWDVAAMLQSGAEFWVGTTTGRPLAYAMTRRGDRVALYFFPMTERCSLVSHCVTLPEARGRGLYVAMLCHIGRTLALEGQTRLYIDCSDVNFASERGIRRVGYSKIGRGIHRRSGAILWRQETPPSVSRLEEGTSIAQTHSQDSP